MTKQAIDLNLARIKEYDAAISGKRFKEAIEIAEMTKRELFAMSTFVFANEWAARKTQAEEQLASYVPVQKPVAVVVTQPAAAPQPVVVAPVTEPEPEAVPSAVADSADDADVEVKPKRRK